MEMLIDSHAHLAMYEAGDERESIIRHAEETGVATILTIGTTIEDSRMNLEIAAQHPQVLTSIGVHPHDVKEVDLDQCLEALRQLSLASSVVALGEIGLDYYWNHSPQDMQQTFFREQLELAKALDLPVIIHDRDAHDDTLRIIEEVDVSSVGGVFHCFSGDLAMAERVRELGFLVSIAGPVTFKKAGELPCIAKMLPLESLLIETDCPYLTPAPFRGKRNEPAYVRYTAAKIAEIRGVSLEDIAEQTALNFFRLFRKGNAQQQQ